MIRITRIVQDGTSRAGSAWQSVQTQPNWVVRGAAIVFALVLALPILALVVLALLAAIVVFGVLWLVHRVKLVFAAVLPRRDGRRNVRVVRRDP